jgi:hypothetical protein
VPADPYYIFSSSNCQQAYDDRAACPRRGWEDNQHLMGDLLPWLFSFTE